MGLGRVAVGGDLGLDAGAAFVIGAVVVAAGMVVSLTRAFNRVM